MGAQLTIELFIKFQKVYFGYKEWLNRFDVSLCARGLNLPSVGN